MKFLASFHIRQPSRRAKTHLDHWQGWVQRKGITIVGTRDFSCSERGSACELTAQQAMMAR